ncbi:Uu.00g018390.m01.CDS01 [Anthostomella pinea]|uniref:Uu.00g018390.m01.CDS01 n=1 Tax=Anthostomella pinea TaxID=933095 RepID=A0AAI8VZN2_9PEZI|nr:Uu.00g018390.m01.CDS01 [Anthostomella pinea]
MSSTWQEIGRIDKQADRVQQQFVGDISTATGIGRPYLLGLTSRYEASVALRMSWAASRKTTRIEDTAYCLLGLFDINMPLLYGEGEKAFQRLQQEIMKVSTDQSIFAWEWTLETTPCEGDLSFIAPSPNCFARCGDFVQLEDRYRSIAASTFTLTNTGLSLRLSIHPMPRTGLAFALLECSHRCYSKIGQYRLCIPIRLGPKSAADGTQLCERLAWPPLPLCIAFFSPALHQLHIPRRSPRPHTNFEGLPTEFLHRDDSHRKGCSIFLLFPPSRYPYIIKSMRHSPQAALKGDNGDDDPHDDGPVEMKYDTIGTVEFHSWRSTEEYDYVGVIVEVTHRSHTVWIHLWVCRDADFIFKACRILKTRRNLLFLSSASSSSSPSSSKATPPGLASGKHMLGNRRYTMDDAVESVRRSSSALWDSEAQSDWFVEMGAQAVDGTGMVIVPVYIDCEMAERGDPEFGRWRKDGSENGGGLLGGIRRRFGRRVMSA